MTVPDPLVAVRKYLLTITAITDIVVAKVYTLELPREVTSDMPVAALVVKASPGSMPGVGCAKLGTSNLEVWAYGVSPQAARNLSLVVYEQLKFLHRVVSNNTLIHDVIPVNAAINFRDPNGDWPIQMQTYRITAAETATP